MRSLGGAVPRRRVRGAEVSATGYAKEMSEDYNARAAAALRRAGRPTSTSSITTALIPGRPAPLLITEEMVASMKPGQRDRRHGRRAGRQRRRVGGRSSVVSTEHGVTIIGYTDLAGRLPAQASQLYGTNVVNLMKLLTPGKDGQLVLDFDDVVQRSMTVVRDGEKTWPPPPVPVSAAPTAPTAAPPALEGGEGAALDPAPVHDRRSRDRAAVPAHRVLAEPADRQLHRLRTGDRHRLLRDRQRPPRTAHPADVDH